MKIHEYQGKELLAKYGVPVPQGRVAATPDEVEAIAREIGKPVVVKAQVHTGGRGKAGGIKVGKTPEEAKEVAKSDFGYGLERLSRSRKFWSKRPPTLKKNIIWASPPTAPRAATS